MFQGIHEEDIPVTLGKSYGLMWAYIMEAIYNPILALVKTSVLLFLLRLGAGVDASTRGLIYGVNAWNVGQAISTLLVVLFQCSPPSYYWRGADSTSGVTGTCVHEGVFYTCTAALTIVSDAMTLWLPIRVFSRLQMRLKMRVALISLFCVGGGLVIPIYTYFFFLGERKADERFPIPTYHHMCSVLLLSILRLVWIVQSNFYSLSTYNIGIVYSVSECALAVIASCGPALRPLFVRWFPGCFGSLAETTTTAADDPRYGHARTYDQYPSSRLRTTTTTTTTTTSRYLSQRQRISTMPSSSTKHKQRTKKDYDDNDDDDDVGYPAFHHHHHHHQYPLQTLHQRSHQAEVESSTPNGSDDAIVPQTGIMMTREYEVNSETASVAPLTERREKDAPTTVVVS